MGLKKRGAIYWCYFQYQNKTYQVTTRTSNLKEAQAFERRFRVEVEAGAQGDLPLTPTLAVLRELDVTRLRAEGRSEAYITRGVINNYKWMIQYFQDVSAVTNESLLAYVKHRKAMGIRRQTISKELTCLKRGFRLAQIPGPGYWPKLPSDDPDEKKASKKHSVLDWYKWLSALEGEALYIPLFALLTGLREGELYRVLPEHIQGNVLEVREKVRRRKGLRRRVVLSPSALNIAQRALPFTSNHKKAHRTACPGTKNITLRDCRAAFATAGDTAGDARATDLAMGHSGVPARYQKEDYDRLERVALAVEGWLVGTVGFRLVNPDKPNTSKTLTKTGA